MKKHIFITVPLLLELMMMVAQPVTAKAVETNFDKVSDTDVMEDNLPSIEASRNLERYFKSGILSNNIFNRDLKLTKAEKIALGSLAYRFAFDRRVPWSINITVKKGTYATEFNQSKKWFANKTKARFTMPFTDNDGKVKQLNAYYLRHPSGQHKTVILAHGYIMNGLQMGPWAKVYYDLGYNVLAPDARAHGKSKGNDISFGWKEKQDYVNWAKKMVVMDPSVQLVIAGVSMGGATTMMSSGENMPVNVKAYVEDCGYTSVSEQMDAVLPIAKRLVAKYLHKNVSDQDMQDVVSYMDKELIRRQGYSLKEASSIPQLQRSTDPMLFIHGGEDTFVPTNMIYDNFAAKPDNKQIWVVPGAGHGLSIVKDLPGYRQTVENFLAGKIK